MGYIKIPVCGVKNNHPVIVIVVRGTPVTYHYIEPRYENNWDRCNAPVCGGKYKRFDRFNEGGSWDTCSH